MSLNENQEVTVTLTVREWAKISGAVLAADILVNAPATNPQWAATRETASNLNNQIIEATS